MGDSDEAREMKTEFDYDSLLQVVSFPTEGRVREDEPIRWREVPRPVPG